ncbi:EamA family transporter [Neorhodopirellula pilleata]|uniref:EamA-like transporter family protein n=1 Tax=Neorhodopirellula pilleata TaxID=2714738 RepID=A0A5C5ZZU1_9BACT|nr:EamA family transporter [Neorhodopirellula pilleata]TWT91863.1 EamA-like transporter family protein [Neorhodopirellula pilleata]
MVLTIISASLLGLYDVVKKISVRGNAVPLVLLISVSIGAIIWAVLLGWQRLFGVEYIARWLVVDPLDRNEHLMLAGKAVLVGTSWTMAFHALKELPLSIAAPIRSTSPLWTLAMAVGWLGERPSPRQWLGIVVVLVFFWGLSIVGQKEGIRFTTNRAVFVMIGATILGAISSIYDKILLQRYGFGPATVQAWFSFYLVPVMIPMAGWWWNDRRRERAGRKSTQPIGTTVKTPAPFHFRYSILLISPVLLAADMAYFTALADPDALVSIVSSLRRTSVMVTILLGSRMIGEVNLKSKAICVAGILIGVLLLMV